MDTISEGFQQLLTDAIVFLPRIASALVIFVIALVLATSASKLVDRGLKRREVDPEVTLLLNKVTRWGIIALGIVIALQQVDFDLTAFLAGLGIVGFTIGFALQDVSKNFIAGLLILLQQPFDLGDAVEVAGFSGNVEMVNLRETQIRTFDGRHVLIPNGDVFTSAIVNFSRTSRRRIELTVGVAYDSDLDLVQRLTLEAIGAIDGILPEPAPAVVFSNFGGSSIDFTLYYWVNLEELGYWDGQTAGVKAVKTAFDEVGIEIPYPIRVVRMQGGVPAVAAG